MSKQLDRLTLLETFVRIAERGSISAAARDLDLSQPSASRQLADLEERLGAQLIRRTTHALTLTPAGQDLLADARQLLDDWDALSERHGHGRSQIKGRLKVVAPIALGQLHLADAMLRFQLVNPDVSIIWELDDEPIRFAETGCDCWIKIGAVTDESLVVRPLASVERLLVAAPSLAESWRLERIKDLELAPFIALNPFEGGHVRLNSSNGRVGNVEPKVRVATNNIFAANRAAKMGAGVAVMPKWFVEPDLNSGALVNVLSSWRAASLELSVAYLPSRHQPLRLRSFVAHISEEVRNISGLNRMAEV